MNEIMGKENIKIENMIYEIRGKQVMLDSDLAILFGYETKNLNRQVQRNINRFPENYCFQLTKKEYRELRCQIVTSNFKTNYGGRRYLPYVFTEHGITMLAGILKSEIAVKISLKIVDTFISMRKYISNSLIEQKYINDLVVKHDKRIELLEETFKQFKTSNNEIYFEGQIYDAYSKIIDILKEAKKELIIIDSYADKTILDIIRNINVHVTLIVRSKSLLTKLDIEKYNRQYNNLTVIYNDTFHDRYFILDKYTLYHCGTSINRIGSKTFSINKIVDKLVCINLINNVYKIISTIKI